MCALCVRKMARAAPSLGRLSSSLLEGLKGGQARVFSSLPEPVDAPAGGSPNAVEGYVAHPSALNPNVLKAEYAVRGALYNKAIEMQNEGKEIIYTNGGEGRRRARAHGGGAW